MKIYENKQNGNATFDAQIDGKVIDQVKMFHYTGELDVLEIEGDETNLCYATELEEANAYYHIISNMDLGEFKAIIQGIFFENI